MLQQFVEAETDAAQCRCRVAAEGGGKSEHDRFLALFGEPRLPGKGAPSQRRPLANLLGIAGRLAQRQQGAVKGVGLELEEPGLVDEAAGLDQVPGAGFALVGFELGFLLGEPGFLLFVRAQRSASERAIGSPYCVRIREWRSAADGTPVC